MRFSNRSNEVTLPFCTCVMDEIRSFNVNFNAKIIRVLSYKGLKRNNVKNGKVNLVMILETR